MLILISVAAIVVKVNYLFIFSLNSLNFYTEYNPLLQMLQFNDSVILGAHYNYTSNCVHDNRRASARALVNVITSRCKHKS